LKTEWPNYADKVNFLAIGIDPTEGPDVLRAYHAEQGYPWPAALGNPQTIEAYRVISTSIKYAIDRTGTILYRRGYGVGPQQGWRDLLQQLAPS
jgi:cytochrome oxidase Cu insertion factor (SCO1/SenC/PrrC family)